MMISFFRFIDKYLIWFFLLIFFRLKHIPFVNKNKIKQSPKKILVIRLWALWSSLLTFPMIKQLKDHYWELVQYDLLASTRNIWVFKNQWYFQNMFNLFSLKDLLKLVISFKKYDLVIDVEEYFRTSTLMALWLGKVSIGYSNLKIRKLWYTDPVYYQDQQHTILTFLDLLNPLGIKWEAPKALEKYHYKTDKLDLVDQLLHQHRSSYKIVMHTGGAETAPERFWAVENWIALIKKLLDDNKSIKIFLSGTAFESASIQQILTQLDDNYLKYVIDLSGKMNLDQFAYFLEKMDLMVSNDTGPMHLSAAMGTKTIGLFGPNLPQRFGAYPLDYNINLYHGDGTGYINAHLGEFKACSAEIINAISVDEVSTTILDLI